MHIIRETIKPGQYVFKVFNKHGALMYHGSSDSTAQAVAQSLMFKESEERYDSSSSVRTGVQEPRG